MATPIPLIHYYIRPPSKRYVESLQARIAVLEEQLVALGKTAKRPVLNDDERIYFDANNDIDESREETPGPGPASSQTPRDPLEEITQLTGRLNIGEDGQLRYFGAQSNYHLLHGPLYTLSTRFVDRARQEGLETVARQGKSAEVPQELQDHLLELYWRWQNAWMYMVHRESFMQHYNEGDMGQYCTRLLITSIFALTARYSDRIELRSNPADPQTAGDLFAEQAKLLLLHECETPTVETVQAAALLSLRWMSENKESQGWLYIGQFDTSCPNHLFPE